MERFDYILYKPKNTNMDIETSCKTVYLLQVFDVGFPALFGVSMN